VRGRLFLVTMMLLALLAPAARSARAQAVQAAGGASGSSPQGSLASPPAGPELLGLTLADAITSFGPPQHVYPVRGDRPWKDDVVFFYSTHLYLYWYDDRVWQIRFDEHFEGSFLGLSMGEDRTAAARKLGKPLAAKDDWDIFQLSDRGFPVRARLFYTAGRISDVYIYRSDF
jgi:hypothetical protein